MTITKNTILSISGKEYRAVECRTGFYFIAEPKVLKSSDIIAQYGINPPLPDIPEIKLEKSAEEIEKLWDEHSRGVPETVYSEEELSWVMGEQVMLKKDFDEAMKIFASQQSNKTEWISVENEPPKLTNNEILVVSDGLIYLAIFQPNGTFIDTASYNNIDGYNKIPVTHWQPVPEPPTPIKTIEAEIHNGEIKVLNRL